MNNTEYKLAKILFIKGVFIKDCIPDDDIFERQIIEQLNYNTSYIEIYNKLPLIFKSFDSWMKKTNLNCWYCDLKFDSVPIFIPKIIEPSRVPDQYNISTFGCFCSFSCAISYNNLYNNRLCENIHIKDMLLFLYKLFNKKSIKEIFQSPSKYQMKQYGGDLEQIQYKNLIIKLKETMKSLEFTSTF
jgi:hypothetical protein